MQPIERAEGEKIASGGSRRWWPLILSFRLTVADEQANDLQTIAWTAERARSGGLTGVQLLV